MRSSLKTLHPCGPTGPQRPWRALLATALLAPCLHAAPVAMNGAGSYSQNFDTLPTSGTTAWVDDSTLPAWYATHSATVNLVAGAGGSNSGALYSFGTGTATERALGSVASGTTNTLFYGVLLQNTGTSAVTINSLAFTGEQWRNGGNTNLHKLEFAYQTSASPITTPGSTTGWTALPAGDFTGPVATATAAALDGNDAANRASVSANPNINVVAGGYVMLRWSDVNDTGADHGLALDNLSIGWVSNSQPTITLTASPATFAENAGATASTGTVTLSAPAAASLTVNLSSSDTTEATVPASVTIAAGQSSATFPISAVNDLLADGPISVTLSASATGYIAGQTLITVTDDTDAPIAVTVVPSTFSENAGANAAVGTVTLAEITPVEVTVTLVSSDITEATVPLSVVIAAGTKSQTFAVSAVNDTLVDGTVSVTIQASAPGYTSGSTIIQVTDDGDVAPQPTLTPGAIQFIEFNADGTDGFAFVVLKPIAATDKITFTDNEWDGGTVGSGGSFNTGEGTLIWSAPAGGLSPGKIVYVYGLTTGGDTTEGTVSLTGSMNLGSGGETVYAYQGDPQFATGFLAIVSTNTDPKEGTGLAASNIVQFSSTIDVAGYTGSRSNQSSYAGYLPLIANTTGNWITQDGAGDQDADGIPPDFPFDGTEFTLTSGGSTYASYAAANAGGQGPDLDFDNDGVKNGVEYFFGATGSSFTPNPQPVGGVITFPRNPAATDAVYKVETSSNLVTWTDVTAATVVDGNSVKYTIPTGQGRLFVRLRVTIPPVVSTSR